MDLLGGGMLPVLVVGGLGALTLGFALLIGRWIDTQSNTVIEEPRKRKQRGEQR
jgi:hypothetical protein